MSEWIGWVSRLRRAIYARMEALSFRTGTATVAGVAAVAVTAILLTLIQGGHHGAPRTAAEAGAAATSSVVTAPVAVFPPPATDLPSPSRIAAPFADYAPRQAKSPTATPQADPSPTARPTKRALWREPGKRPHGTHPSTPGWPLPSPPSFGGER